MISVIVPVYNTVKYLKHCVDSLVTQTYQEYEIFVVNNGSMDDSGAFCDKLALQNIQSRVVHKANGGLSNTRNMEIDEAGG